VGNLPGGVSANLTIQVTAPSTSGNITNTANVSAVEKDPNLATNTASENTTVNEPEADLEIVKDDSPDPVLISENLTYEIKVTNHGPEGATASGVTFISANATSGNVSESAGNVTWNVGNLPSGVSANLTIVASFNATLQVLFALPPASFSGNITNTAVVSANQNDPNPDNNIVSENTTLVSADLKITKSDIPDPVTLGDNLTYILTVTNNGSDNASGVYAIDFLFADWFTSWSATPD
jgi:uncharacterized repeat protein (TIGR01451 family)